MLGVVGAHSLLLRPRVDFEQLDVVLGNLAGLLPGLPDVTALRVLGQETRADAGRPGGEIAEHLPPVVWPPMLVAGYAALVRHDAKIGGGMIVPGSLAESVASSLRGDSIWTAWNATQDRLLEPRRRRGGLFSLFGGPDLGEALRSIGAPEPAIRKVADYLAGLADLEEPGSFKEMLETEQGNPANIAAATTVPLMVVEDAIQAIEDREP